MITGEHRTGPIVEAMKKFISPRLIGEDIANLNRITRLIHGWLEKDSSRRPPSRSRSTTCSASCTTHRSTRCRRRRPGDHADITISVDYIRQDGRGLGRGSHRGFESLKIKVGKDIGVDIERVKAIYPALEGRALLRFDANQGWTAKQAVYALQTLEIAGVAESWSSRSRHRTSKPWSPLPARVTPIMADESVFGPTRSHRADWRARRWHIDIKLMKPAGCRMPSSSADIAAM